jgi:hypothetical protein
MMSGLRVDLRLQSKVVLLLQVIQKILTRYWPEAGMMYVIRNPIYLVRFIIG